LTSREVHVTALWLFLSGVATILAAGVFAAVGISMGFGGIRGAPAVVVVACLCLLAGVALVARAFGFGWVGAP
jgi:hypothetical protein